MDKVSPKKSIPTESLDSERIFKKSSSNSLLCLYLGSRNLIARQGKPEPLRGVIYTDPKYLSNSNLFVQIVLTFRYGREDEEVMGLKFCNEAVIAFQQIWPKTNSNNEDVTPLQQAIVQKLGQGALPFTLELKLIAPPNVQLVPAKKYNGAPIGTSYDVRGILSAQTDEKTIVKLGIHLIHLIPPNSVSSATMSPTKNTLPRIIRLRLSPKAIKFKQTNNFSNEQTDSDIYSIGNNLNTLKTKSKINATSSYPSSPFMERNENFEEDDINKPSSSKEYTNLKGPEVYIDKPFLWTDGHVSLRATLNKTAYEHGEKIILNLNIKNCSRRIIRKIRIFAVQYVDVCMFSNGKFKNIVADINENHSINPGEIFNRTYDIIPIKGQTKNWIAVEHSLGNSSKNGLIIASSAYHDSQSILERNVFSIFVSYYIKIKVTLSVIGGEVSVKLPFMLGHIDKNIPTEELNYIYDKISDQEPMNIKNKDDIIEELPDEQDLTCNKKENENFKIDNRFNEDKNLLYKYKLNRNSFSKSCEEVDIRRKTNVKNNTSVTSALIHS